MCFCVYSAALVQLGHPEAEIVLQEDVHAVEQRDAVDLRH
jgi:hypothetical protein